MPPWGFDDQTFLFDRLDNNGKYPPSIAMVCAQNLNAAKSKCDRNILWMDGMHICPETMAARHSASLACLLACVYNKPHSVNNEHEYENALRSCERDCNEQQQTKIPLKVCVIVFLMNTYVFAQS